jgi:hypothetical protein
MDAEGRFPIQTPYFESVNTPNLYFAGNAMGFQDYKKSSSYFIHGFRHNIDSLFAHIK